MLERAALERLDTVDWAGLTHAYGYAADVPGQIRLLLSADPDVRAKGLGELYGNIFHQGTRYEASAHAVPFLLETLTDPETPDRASILGLLTCLAVGYGEEYLPAGYPIAEHRAAAVGGEDLLAAGRAYTDEDDEDVEDEEEDDWETEPALFAYMQTLDPDDDGRLGAYVALAAYDAVRAGLPLIRSLAADADAGVRTAAVHVLAWFPEAAAESRPVLVAAADDPDPAVAATALVALALLDSAEKDPFRGVWGVVPPQETGQVLESALDDPRDLVRWGAAIGLARFRGGDAGPGAAAELHGWVGRDGGPHEAVPFLDGDLRGYAARSLPLLGEAYADGSFAALLARLPRVSGIEALPVAETLLEMVFPDPLPAGTPFSDLDERQRRLVIALAGSPATWRLDGMAFGNFSMLVGGHGLPSDPEAMSHYITGAEPA
ncbi:HEAT repeat domain-containing protein [Actinomadura graeca]|uniref:HEAT repeat domain-containing protein n=1 Tax=Actinomadura graeca TaxID=2750812 RepID=A0ABX8QW18_9ACTN|nr:HEAT repeat domain-containing protein [Actinomadura graeca]QXJ20978.1 HEAT repeat domain-containing protein [Actinomadura graeca]